MEDQKIRKDIISRLRTIKGHISGIEKMVDEGKECSDILVQITAIKSSIEKVGLLIIEDHAKACILKENLTSDDAQNIIRNIVKFMK
ncbi:metal-sensitive transcriptional regulator [Serpentinicella alkaliphila]|uniref:DNA-binding FrmR family transcriptional regulator n=1 Tax=Serpentinicella alkaliphila TaxID=1734049 RepID=A0A4R2TKC1_9FIRM|nr:metal-sensitive transcriptional regulator [Serpentinicella alkaliphila]QUH26456.1 metal-sensitive transcriptional regulator [Serpentinicella alkaliphila]TCQ03266.1 DNA-binding FrmR family transcriptional regulator [Serpentinicella alkaliphila]